MPEDKKLVRIDTVGLSQNDARKAWTEWTNSNYCYTSRYFYNDRIFSGESETLKFSQGTLVRSQLTGSRTERTLAHISKDKQDEVCVLYVDDGTLIISNKHGKRIAKRNSIVLNDCAAPFITDSIGLNFTCFSIKRSLVNSFIGDPEELFSQEISKGSPWEKALVDIMRELKPGSVAEQDYPRDIVAECIISLLTLSAGPASEPLRSSQLSLLERLHRDMYDQLSDSSLNPASFAAAHGISLRTLHAIFAESGTSFMKYLMELRLEKAKTMLESKHFAGSTIAEVCFLTGFVNPEHFSTRFHKKYGISPKSYRASRNNGIRSLLFSEK